MVKYDIPPFIMYFPRTGWAISHSQTLPGQDTIVMTKVAFIFYYYIFPLF